MLGPGHTRSRDQALPSRCSRPKVIPRRRLSRGRGLRRLLPPFQSPSRSCMLPPRFLSMGCLLPSLGSCRSLCPEGCLPSLNMQTPRSLPLHLEDRSWCLSARQTRGELLSGRHAAFASSQPGDLGRHTSVVNGRRLSFFSLSLERPEPPGHCRTPPPPGFQTMVLCPRLLLTLRPGSGTGWLGTCGQAPTLVSASPTVKRGTARRWLGPSGTLPHLFSPLSLTL